MKKEIIEYISWNRLVNIKMKTYFKKIITKLQGYIRAIYLHE